MVLYASGLAGIRVDPAEEIMANKLCTLLARAEVRDVIDLRALEGAGRRSGSG
jgi:predicted nucleotidyltransferase component of viral defense system